MDTFGNAYRLQGWNGVDLDLEPNHLGTIPRVASFTDHNTVIAVEPHKRFHRPRQPRLLYKDGAYTLIGKNIPNVTSRFFSDFWNTMLDFGWCTILCFFLCSSVALWLSFALVFWIISYSHGDFEPQNYNNGSFIPCIYFENMNRTTLSTTFTHAFLFAVETLRTIGYGTPRYPTDECVSTLFFLCFGLIVSCLLESVLVGLLLAKTHVPQKRTQTLLFSQCATICTRNDQRCLLFRVGNVRTSLLLRVALKAYLVYAKRTDEGEEMPFHQHEIDLQIDCNGDHVYLGWPITACHVIDASSPFYHVSKKNLSRAAFEILVILEGIVESTGSSIQARTSYIPDEILWGHRFRSVYTHADRHHVQVFDFTHFDSTEPQAYMKDHSAFELNERALLTSPLNTPAPTPVILMSLADEEPSGMDYTDSMALTMMPKEAVLTPSLAKALDIPYDIIQSRSRAGTRRGSTQAPSRRVSRVETYGQEGLRLPHPCSASPVIESFEPYSMPLRRTSISVRAGPMRQATSYDDFAGFSRFRKLSTP